MLCYTTTSHDDLATMGSPRFPCSRAATTAARLWAVSSASAGFARRHAGWGLIFSGRERSHAIVCYVREGKATRRAASCGGTQILRIVGTACVFPVRYST